VLQKQSKLCNTLAECSRKDRRAQGSLFFFFILRKGAQAVKRKLRGAHSGGEGSVRWVLERPGEKEPSECKQGKQVW
jgi:hypothetical protein